MAIVLTVAFRALAAALLVARSLGDMSRETWRRPRALQRRRGACGTAGSPRAMNAMTEPAWQDRLDVTSGLLTILYAIITVR